jgi:group I intron endonuclease
LSRRRRRLACKMPRIVTCGVYGIFNSTTGKVYIGSAVRVERRWTDHRHFLRIGRHHSPHLQAAWEKDGEDAFLWVVLESCSSGNLQATEQKWIDSFDSANRTHGYNVSRSSVAPMLGRRHSEASKEKMSKSTISNWSVPENRARLIGDRARKSPAATVRLPDSERRRLRSETSAALWKDPAYRAKNTSVPASCR